MSRQPTTMPTGDAAERKAAILLVDDDQIILDSLGGFLELEGYEVTTAGTITRAIDCLAAGSYNLVITDVSMPISDGFELLRHVRTHHEDVVVILVTGYGTIESAVEAMKLGAYDYLTKPIIDDDVRMAVQRALQQQQLLAENRRLEHALAERYSFANIIGQDYRMSRVFDLIDAVADSRTTALITGESGTGKSLIARGPRALAASDTPIRGSRLRALPDTLLESELFGHMRGAFTHAVSDKQGRFAAAHTGTIFLDEIATASPQLQVKLLRRVLQSADFEPIGSNETQEVNVRVILATNHDLQAEVRAGVFREDLYYRINVVNIELPTLRERIGDIPLLAEHFLAKYLQWNDRKDVQGFSPEAMERMQRYHWPGNVRELENCVERAVVLCRRPMILPDDLPPAVLQGASSVASGAYVVKEGLSLQEAMEAPERDILLAALRANNGNRQATAQALRINRTTLYKKMKKFALME